MTTSLLLSQRCKLIKKVEALDSLNRPSYIEITVKDKIPCRLDVVTRFSNEAPNGAVRQATKNYVIYADPLASATDDMFIELDSVRYQIKTVHHVSGMNGKTHHTEIDVVVQTNV